ncbi:MAG: C10 family peptidase [Alistipes sp.]|nr:C10 family peptidase [Alistipes sp.]
MRKSYLVLLLVAMFAITSCDYNDEQLVVNPAEQAEEAIINGKVPFSRAISNADFVFKNIDGTSAKKRKVRSVDVLTRPNSDSKIVSTRSSSLSEDDKPLAYVVNYENNEGFAILAADTKLPPVISIGDEGNFDTEGFANFVQNNGATRSDSDLNPAQEVQYAIISNSLELPSVNIGSGTLVSGVDTTIMLKCMPLVTTKWGQEAPYDYYSPMKPNNSGKGYAGCVPVAGAQVLASLCYHHNWRPTTQLSNTYTVDWYTINRIIFANIIGFSSNDTSANALAVASLIRAVGEDVDADYKNNGTGAPTKNLEKTFDRLGMANTVYGNESTRPSVTINDVFTTLFTRNYPVIVRAEDSYASSGGHAFIFDGWLRIEYNLLANRPMEGMPEISRPDNTQIQFDLVHLNLGWYGCADGYYLPDAINLTEDKYYEYAEDNDTTVPQPYIYDLDMHYLIYRLF